MRSKLFDFPHSSFTVLAFSILLGLTNSIGLAQTSLGTEFTYQGRLNDAGSPVTGQVDIIFTLYDAATLGNVVGTPVVFNGQAGNGAPIDATDGLFTANPDFGADVYDGTALWLEIQVRSPHDPTDTASYTTLAPRQPLTAAPYALALPGLSTIQDVDSPSIMGGSNANWITSGVIGATISGGGSPGVSVGPIKITDDYGTVGGGRHITAGNNEGTTSDASYATVGGGFANSAAATHATVAGGSNNFAREYASAVGGGWNCDALGRYATSPGGNDNFAGGDWSFAAGRAATVRHGDPDWHQMSLYSGDADGDEGTFVWADSTHDLNDPFVSTGPNQFLISAAGGVGIGTNTPSEQLDVSGNIAVSGTVDGVDLSAHAADPNAHHVPPTTLPPSGPAGGDLGGSYPNPTVNNDSHVHGDGTISDILSIDNGRLYAPAGSGNVGVGIATPARKLHVSNGSSGGASQSTADLVVEDNGSCYINLMSTDSFERGISFGSPASNVHGGIYYTNGDGLELRTNNNNTALVVNANGRVAIGIPAGSNDAELHVQNNSGASRPIKCDRVGSDGQLLAWARDDLLVGDVAVAGGTVSYNAFTGSHYAWPEEAIEPGWLVVMTGHNRWVGPPAKSELIYGIAPSSLPNDSRCLGAYFSHGEPAEPTRERTPDLVAAVGNGEMWVVESGRDIRPGDYLISSDVRGHAMLDHPKRFSVGYIVARAAEAVEWSDVDAMIADRKHKRISVFFESFVRDNSSNSEIMALSKQNAELESRLAKLETMLSTIQKKSDMLATRAGGAR